MIMRVAAALLIVLIAIALSILPAAAQGGDELPEEPAIPPEIPQGTGTITGIVLSSVDSHAIPDALVTLYDMDGNIVPVPENPQFTSSGIGNNAGIYTFFDVPYGIYNITAAKGDVWFFAIVDLGVGQGTVTANIVLPEYVETMPAYQLPPEPTPIPKPVVDFVPIRTGKAPAPTLPDEGLPIGLAVAGGIGALLLFGRSKSEE
jgi:hypothetical protein